jgi:hypothetical protein
MWHRDLLRRGQGRAVVAALALLIFAAGFCAFDRDHDGHDDRPMLHDLCLLALLVPATGLLLVGLMPNELALGCGQPAVVTGPLSVPTPPPRSAHLA